jgi:diaminohydroxyphosphoribosylaminopyrimidine deaminase/5-amino-6-(5-phosphoribosylamino)uracil reductase
MFFDRGIEAGDRSILKDKDETFMKEALRQAKKGMGRTSPNPAVGAVIVRQGRVIASGYHKRAGAPHAEVEALSRIGGKARQGDTLYVTLEPCHHRGRTPPCTEAILRWGLQHVVVGMKDPNPHVTGGGCEFLAEKGVDVRVGILEPECRRLNEWFLKFVTTGRPFVIAKTALTMDGWTATVTGHSQWVTNERSRRFGHRLRDQVDGIMVGIGTVLADDPLLTTRLKRGPGKDPVRIVVDTRLKIPAGARVLHADSDAETVLAVGEGVSEKRLEAVRKSGISTLVCPKKEGKIDLTALMDRLGAMSVTSILLEGGAGLMGAMIRERLVDKFFFFKAPKILGGDDGIPMAAGPGPKRMDASLCLKDVETRRLGEDLLVVGYPDYPST